MGRLAALPGLAALATELRLRLTRRFPCWLLVGAPYNIHCFIESYEHYTNFFRLLDRMEVEGLRISTVRVKRGHTGAPPPGANGFYLPVRLRTLNDLSLARERITPEIRRIFDMRADSALLFDLSGEAVCDEVPLAEHFVRFHASLKAAGIPAHRVWLIHANASPRFYEAWQQVHGADYPVRTLGYHFYVYAIMHKIATSAWFQRYPELLLQAAEKDVSLRRLRPKHFMTLNLKPRMHRVALMVFLLARGLLPKGIVTYIGDDAPKPAETKWNAPAMLYDLMKQVPGNEAIVDHFDALERMRPITYECTESKLKGIWTKPGDIRFIVPELREQKKDVRLQSYVEFVTETYFGDDTTLYITEKTLRPILRMQAFLHLGGPFVMKELRAMGFKTFSPLIDERYDEIVDAPARMAAILAEIDRLCAMPAEELHALYAQLLPVFIHNYRHLYQQYRELFMKDASAHLLGPLASPR